MSSQWTQYTNDEGYDYWYNEGTGESTWENPHANAGGHHDDGGGQAAAAKEEYKEIEGILVFVFPCHRFSKRRPRMTSLRHP